MRSVTKLSVISTALIVIISTSAQATGPNNGQPLGSYDQLFSLGGTVTAQIIGFNFGGGPGSRNNVYFAPTGTVSGAQYLGQNYDFSSATPVTLNATTVGQEVILGIETNVWGGNSQGYDNFFVTGPGSRNADGQIHAFISADTLNGKSGYRVDFEDLPSGSSDWNYGDASVFVTGVSTQATPEPTSIAVLGLGVLGFARRRFKK